MHKMEGVKFIIFVQVPFLTFVCLVLAQQQKLKFPRNTAPVFEKISQPYHQARLNCLYKRQCLAVELINLVFGNNCDKH